MQYKAILILFLTTKEKQNPLNNKFQLLTILNATLTALLLG